MHQPQPALPEPDDVPDRTPPAHAHYRQRTRKTCVVCSGPFLVATSCKGGYQTCSAECSRALRSQSQQARFGRTPRADSAQRATPPNAERRTPNAAVEAQSRPDVVLVGRAGADVLCVVCGGLRGRWMRSELPPPELCWRCLMRRNAGYDPGMPLG